jgi:hypothetical protein
MPRAGRISSLNRVELGVTARCPGASSARPDSPAQAGDGLASCLSILGWNLLGEPTWAPPIFGWNLSPGGATPEEYASGWRRPANPSMFPCSGGTYLGTYLERNLLGEPTWASILNPPAPTHPHHPEVRPARAGRSSMP